MTKFVKIEAIKGDIYIAPAMVTSIRAYPAPTDDPVAAYSAVALLGSDVAEIVKAPPEVVVEMLG